MPNADEFDRLVAHYFEQVDAGVEIDPHAFMTDNPDHAVELQGLFKNLGVLDNVFGTAPRAEKPRASTDNIGDFRIVRELGRGGMGIVYEAEEISVGRRVALKVLYASAALDLARLTRFQNESRASASLSHIHIVPVYSVGAVEGTHYFAMKLIDGSSLAEIIKATLSETGSHSLAAHIGLVSATTTFAGVEATHLQSRSTFIGPASTLVSGDRSLDFTRICNLVSDVARALEHTHQRGIVHRDIKPSNLLIDTDGSVWVTDFGLAHIDQEATITATGEILGTLQYMSPEQATGQDLDHRSDI